MNLKDRARQSRNQGRATILVADSSATDKLEACPTLLAISCSEYLRP